MSELREKRRRKKKTRIIISVIAAALITVCIGAAIFNCFRKVTLSQENALIDDMRAMVNSQATNLETEVNQIQSLLLSLRDVLRTNHMEREPISDTISMLRPIVAMESMNRIGIADANGDVLTTDGLQLNLSFAEFFKTSMQGHNYISDLITDSIVVKDYDIIVFSVPLYEYRGEVTHVLYAVYDAAIFYEKLNIDVQDEGAQCVITDLKGHFISNHYADYTTNDRETIFDFLPVSNETEKMRTELLSKQSGYVLLPNQGDYVYYSPFQVDTGASTWAILCFVPRQALSDRMSEILYDIPRMIVILTILILIAVGIFLVNRRLSVNEDRQKLRHIAFTDRLTRGYNYAYFEEMMHKRDRYGFVISMDIHAFRTINSAVGTRAGDQVLIAIWNVLDESLKPGELAAHVNSDHYTMFLHDSSKSVIAERLTGITERIKEISNLLGTPEVVPYFGACECDVTSELKEVENRAITSRHLIRMNSEKNYAFYSDFDSGALLEESKMLNDFEKAIHNREFVVWYQPKYNPATSELVGAEALVRWQSNSQIIPPFKFIPLYEQNGKIRELDLYMFRSICEQLAAWKESGHRLIPISVNLSRVSAYQIGLVEKYAGIMDEYGLDYHLVPIEITESAAVDDEVIRNVVNDFYEKGFSVHMDDFGSGYSSLSSLVNLHFDSVKMDKSLTDTIGKGDGEKIITHAISLAKELGLHVTVEGVENEQQLYFLKPLQCDNIQGYYYSKPLPLAEFMQIFV